MSKSKDLGVSSQEYEDAVNLEKLYSLLSNASKCYDCRKRKPSHVDCESHKLICQSCAKGKDECKEIGVDRIKSSEIRKLEKYYKSSSGKGNDISHKNKTRSRRVRSPSPVYESDEESVSEFENYRPQNIKSSAHHSSVKRPSKNINNDPFTFDEDEYTPGMRSILKYSSPAEAQSQIVPTSYYSQVRTPIYNTHGYGAIPSAAMPSAGTPSYPTFRPYTIPNTSQSYSNFQMPSFYSSQNPPLNYSSNNFQPFLYPQSPHVSLQNPYPSNQPQSNQNFYPLVLTSNPMNPAYTNFTSTNPSLNFQPQFRPQSFTPDFNYMTSPSRIFQTQSNMGSNTIRNVPSRYMGFNRVQNNMQSNAPFVNPVSSNPFYSPFSNQSFSRSRISNNPFAF